MQVRVNWERARRGLPVLILLVLLVLVALDNLLPIPLSAVFYDVLEMIEDRYMGWKYVASRIGFKGGCYSLCARWGSLN